MGGEKDAGNPFRITLYDECRRDYSEREKNKGMLHTGGLVMKNFSPSENYFLRGGRKVSKKKKQLISVSSNERTLLGGT